MFKWRGFKFITKLDVEYRKIESDDETKYSTFYLNSKAEKIFDKGDIDGVFKSIYIMII